MNERKDKILMRIPLLVLILITIGFWSFYDRYEPTAPPLMQTPELSNALIRRGNVSQTNGIFTLKVPHAKKTVRVDFPLKLSLATSALVRVQVEMKIENVVPRNNPWERARLLLGQYDAHNKWVSVNHQVMGREGTLPWTHYVEIFEVKPATRTAHLILQQVGSSGTAYFKNICVEPVRIKSSFLWWRILFALAWIGMGIYYFPRCRLNKRKLKILILLNAIAILIGALMPADWMKSISNRIQKARTEWVQSHQPPPPKKITKEKTKKPKKGKTLEQTDRFEELVKDTHKSGHFTLFATLCFLVYLSSALERQKPIYLFKAGLDVLLFAVVTETLQLLTIDRSAGVNDLLIDLKGMLLAFTLFMLFVWPFFVYKNRKYNPKF